MYKQAENIPRGKRSEKGGDVRSVWGEAFSLKAPAPEGPWYSELVLVS